MIIAKIVQTNQNIEMHNTICTFQYSNNLQMQFVRDEQYKDYVLIGFYRQAMSKDVKLLDIDENGYFSLGSDVFENEGTVQFSFSLNGLDKEIHLGIVEYVIRQSFGKGDEILPENKDSWVQVVSRVVEEQTTCLWNKEYKPQIEENLKEIEKMTNEINVVSEAVKQDAIESSNSAKSALGSVNEALGSANLAKEAKEKALECANSAEQHKNNALNYASVANRAKEEALKSATDANTSASNALASSTKAKEHLDNVNSAVVKFNKDVESANNTLNAKIEKANTDIDKKVLDANTNLDTKIAGANTSIDAKVTEATKQAGIATSKATELTETVGKVNTLESSVKTLDAILDTKLTQPYVSNNGNTHLADSDNGKLQNLVIGGGYTQTVETDVVPTPSRPIPIVSKKIMINNENVELRSLKETVNLIDINYAKAIGIVSNNAIVNDDNSIQVSQISFLTGKKSFINITKSANYSMSWKFEALSGGATRGLIVLMNAANDNAIAFNNNTNGAVGNARWLDKGVYYVQISTGQDATDPTNNVIKYSNIMLVEGTTVPSTYVAPTIRDYKIVDHVNKKSWIERNVVQDVLNGSESGWGNDKGIGSNLFTNYRVSIDSMYVYPNDISNLLCNKLLTQIWVNNRDYEFVGSYSNILYFRVLRARTDNLEDVEKWKEYIQKYPFTVQYRLKTATVEEIPYLESDTSEFGYSYQDTTSPSPGIPSEPTFIGDYSRNLFDASKLPTITKLGCTITNNNDGSFTISGNATGTFYHQYKFSNEDTINMLKNGDLKIKQVNCYPYIYANVAGKEINYTIRSYENNPLINITNEMLNDETLTITIGFYYIYNETNKVTPITIKPMLYQNGNGTWRPYTEVPKYYLDFATCGKNLFNKSSAQTDKGLKIDGTVINAGNYFVSDFIEIMPSTNYVKSGLIESGYTCLYDENKNFLISDAIVDGTFTTNSKTKYLRFNSRIGALNTAQFEAGSTPTSYEQYKEIDSTIVLEEPLRALPNGVKDTIENGNVIRRIGKIVFDGSDDELITFHSVNIFNIANFYLNLNAYNIKKESDIIVDKFQKQNTIIANTTTEGIFISGTNVYLRLNNLRADTVAKLRTYLQSNPITVYYELATPIIEPLTQEQIAQLEQLKTYYPATNVVSNAPLNFDYKLNLKAWHNVVDTAQNIIYDMQVQQNNIEVMQLETALEMQYNTDLYKLGGF